MIEIFSFIMLIILAFINIKIILPIKTTFDGQAIIIIVLVVILSIPALFKDFDHSNSKDNEKIIKDIIVAEIEKNGKYKVFN